MKFHLAWAMLFVLITHYNHYADAATFDLIANLDGVQSGTGSPATGTALVTYDDGSNLLSWDISWLGLTGTESAMHFHGPAAPGTNAGVKVGIDSVSGLVSPSIGSTTIDTTQAADLLNELYYINLHSSVNPGGEIRGQVLLVPEPAGLALGGFAVLGLLALRRR